MSTKSPPTRRKFKTAGDEINYLYDKLLFWLYGRGNPRQALRFAGRLERLLTPSDREAIMGQECLSLIRELKGDLPRAIKHRNEEIRLIRRLHETSLHTPSREIILKAYDFSDLSDRLDLLAILYHELGDLDEAIRVLEESKQLCRSHRIPFDAQDVLDEYLSERAGIPWEARNGKKPQKRPS
jgi:tetratricopeptide (TPR) repeat protein